MEKLQLQTDKSLDLILYSVIVRPGNVIVSVQQDVHVIAAYGETEAINTARTKYPPGQMIQIEVKAGVKMKDFLKTLEDLVDLSDFAMSDKDRIKLHGKIVDGIIKHLDKIVPEETERRIVEKALQKIKKLWKGTNLLKPSGIGGEDDFFEQMMDHFLDHKKEKNNEKMVKSMALTPELIQMHDDLNTLQAEGRVIADKLQHKRDAFFYEVKNILNLWGKEHLEINRKTNEVEVWEEPDGK